MTDEQRSDRKVVATIQFTDEQRKVFQDLFGKDAESADIVEFSDADAKRLAPGVPKVTGMVLAW